MKIQNLYLFEQGFMDAFQKLLAIDMPAEDCLIVVKIAKQIQSQYKDVNDARKLIMDRHVLKDDRGNMCKDAENKILYKDEDTKLKCIQEMRDLMKATFEISFERKIKIGKEAKLTPNDLMILEDFLEVHEEKIVDLTEKS